MRTVILLLILMAIAIYSKFYEPPRKGKIYSYPIKVAVIDTGIKKEWMKTLPLCETGHKDFTGFGLEDIHGHGTNVADIITQHATGEYCLVIVKFFDPRNINSLDSLIKAIGYSIQNADIINISGGGPVENTVEEKLIKLGLNNDKIFIVAAGNDKENLDEKCTYFPACYDPRLIVVGNGRNGIPNDVSNYGKVVDLWINGMNIKGGGHRMSGTSQSTAIVTGNMVSYLNAKIGKIRLPQGVMEEKVAEAVSKQFKLGKKFDRLIGKHIPKEIKDVAPAVKVLKDGKVNLKWEF